MERITLDSEFMGYVDDKEWPHFAWAVTIRCGRQSLTTSYHTGLAHCKRVGPSDIHKGARMDGRTLVRMDVNIARAVGIARPAVDDLRDYVKVTPPSLTDVLQSLQSDASVPLDFEEFCSDFGYDSDSRKAEATHKACLTIRLQLLDLFGAGTYERFMNVDFDDSEQAAAFIEGEV